MGERVRWAVLAFRQRCRPEADHLLDRRARMRWTLKAVVCLAARRWETRNDWEVDSIIVAMGDEHRWTHHEYGAAADWDELAVSIDRWRVSVRANGYP